jgi:ribonuclease E
MSWLDDDSIYGIFNKPNHRGPGTHYDEDKAHESSKPIPASGGAEKEDILMTDFMPSAAEVKKESDALFAEVGNQGNHAGNTAADDGDEDDDDDDDAPARPAGRGGKRGGAGRKADAPEVKAAKAAARAETKTEAKVIEAAKLAAIKANLAASVDTPAASEGGGAEGAAAAARRKSVVGPRPARSRPSSKAPSRRGSVESLAEAAAPAVAAPAAAAAAPRQRSAAVKAVFEAFEVPETATRMTLYTELSKKGNTIEILKPRATALGLAFASSIKKTELMELILDRIYSK